jgi:hypothetical protein
MTEYAGTQVGADGKRHAVADIADFAIPPDPDAGDHSWAVTLLQSALRSAGDSSEPLHVGDRTEARLDLAVTAIAGTNEIQTVTLNAATGGTFTLTYAGQTTSAIAWNAAASVVQTALEALSNIAPGDVVVTGSAGGPYTLTFGGTLASTNVATLTSNAASLTSGSTATITHNTSTAGVAPALNITVETASTSTGSWTSVGTFSAASTVSTQHKVFGDLDEYVRLTYTITGGSLTFSVAGEII